MRENLTHGLMRGGWKPGMVAGTEAPPERMRGVPPGTCSRGACLLLYSTKYEVLGQGRWKVLRGLGSFRDRAPASRNTFPPWTYDLSSLV